MRDDGPSTSDVVIRSDDDVAARTVDSDVRRV